MHGRLHEREPADRILQGLPHGRLRRGADDQARRRARRSRRRLNVELDVTLGPSTTTWLRPTRRRVQRPDADIQFHGPDFNAILAKFQTLSLSSIAQALQLIIQFVQGLAQPGTTIGDLMSEKLPLINTSLSQILNVASDITSKIQAAIQSPASAIQQLNNVLAAAFGLPTPSANVTVTTPGGTSDARGRVARDHRRRRHLHDQLHAE